MRLLIVLLLALSLVGCKKPPDKDIAAKDTGAPVADKEKKHFDIRVKEGSSTFLGKARDRVLDARDAHDANQLKIMLMADGQGPGSDAEWARLLGTFKRLNELRQEGALHFYHNVKYGSPTTVMLYEKSLDGEEKKGLVLTADSTLHTMDKAKFDTLTKPKP
ncbi:MAG: hypothetical protein K2W96_13215 [Gemmataceae bacterium]|nr:hypothetical protein [Gemmataceae bacterium]